MCKANINGHDLRGRHRKRARLAFFDLKYADLSTLNLAYADLSGFDLRGADLSGANLLGANLDASNLIDANFSHNIQNCRSFNSAKFSVNALPWLILHPKWPLFKHSVQIVD